MTERGPAPSSTRSSSAPGPASSCPTSTASRRLGAGRRRARPPSSTPPTTTPPTSGWSAPASPCATARRGRGARAAGREGARCPARGGERAAPRSPSTPAGEVPAPSWPCCRGLLRRAPSSPSPACVDPAPPRGAARRRRPARWARCATTRCPCSRASASPPASARSRSRCVPGAPAGAHPARGRPACAPAGAGEPDPTPKLVRALGPAGAGAARPARAALGRDPTMADGRRAGRHRRSVQRLLAHDPVVRLDPARRASTRRGSAPGGCAAT